MTMPTPKIPLPWLKNPSYGTGEDTPPFLVGDRLLVAVPLHEDSGGGFDIQVIVGTETGFDMDGESWSAWDWWDVEFYIPLDGMREKENVTE